MHTSVTQRLQKKNRINKWFLVFCFSLLAIFPIYRNFYYSNGLLTYERHMAFMEKRSDFYNPWQYRILCPYLVESFVWVYDHTVDKLYPVEEKIHFKIEHTSDTNAETDMFVKLMQTPGTIKYMIVFILFRFAENMLIFYLAWKLWNYYVKSKWLLFFGINFLALALGNAVAIADLAFNTYMDIIFYLLIANIIVYRKSAWLVIPISILSAFNRETGLLIPVFYFISQMDFTKFLFNKINVRSFVFPPVKIWMITIISYIFFLTISVAIRIHYGYVPQQPWKVPAGLPMLKLNLISAVAVKGYLELIGTFGVIPLIILYKFKKFPHLLKKQFLFLAPIWFLVHYVSVTAYQTRLFLVPIVTIMIPMVLWLIEMQIKESMEKERSL